MKVAVTSQNFRSVTAHAGKTRRFLIFDLRCACSPRESERLDLPKEMSFHEFRGDRHPLDGVSALITGGAHGVSAIGNAVTFAGILAALSPIAFWLMGHKEETMIEISYGDAVFWGTIIAVQLLIANISRRGPAPYYDPPAPRSVDPPSVCSPPTWRGSGDAEVERGD